MPAIQPARLKIRISQLIEDVNSPELFITQLNDLLFFYADRTRKPGREGKKYSLTRSYNVPKQVFREVEARLHPILSTQTDSALSLADALWDDGWLETRILAMMILSWVSPGSPREILSRVETWAGACKGDQELLHGLAVVLTVHWKDSPTSIYNLIESWVKSHDPPLRKLGLRVILPLVQIPSFQYLPGIYTILTPLVQRSGLVPDPDLLAAVRGLARISPQETSYFLQKNLAIIENTGVFTLIRLSLESFPPTVKAELQLLIHKRRDEFGSR